jgi:hypothetical protein
MDCSTHELLAAVRDMSRNHFPLMCRADRSQLHPFSHVYLRTIALELLVESLLYASLTHYIRSNPGLYRNCPTPDCNAVYPPSDLEEIYTCPSCLEQTCTHCHAQQHFGSTCAEFQESKSEAEGADEQVMSEYVESTGTKTCPRCTMLIERMKDDDCYNLECSSCHVHKCWLCLYHSDDGMKIVSHIKNKHPPDKD